MGVVGRSALRPTPAPAEASQEFDPFLTLGSVVQEPERVIRNLRPPV